MRHLLVSSLMLVTVAVFLFLKISGYLKLEELNPLSLIGLKLVLFVVGCAFYAVSVVKLIHMLIRYEPSPFVILIYACGLLLAAVASFFTVRWLTRK